MKRLYQMINNFLKCKSQMKVISLSFIGKRYASLDVTIGPKRISVDEFRHYLYMDDIDNMYILSKCDIESAGIDNVCELIAESTPYDGGLTEIEFLWKDGDGNIYTESITAPDRWSGGWIEEYNFYEVMNFIIGKIFPNSVITE